MIPWDEARSDSSVEDSQEAKNSLLMWIRELKIGHARMILEYLGLEADRLKQRQRARNGKLTPCPKAESYLKSIVERANGPSDKMFKDIKKYVLAVLDERDIGPAICSNPFPAQTGKAVEASNSLGYSPFLVPSPLYLILNLRVDELKWIVGCFFEKGSFGMRKTQMISQLSYLWVHTQDQSMKQKIYDTIGHALAHFHIVTPNPCHYRLASCHILYKCKGSTKDTPPNDEAKFMLMIGHVIPFELYLIAAPQESRSGKEVEHENDLEAEAQLCYPDPFPETTSRDNL